MNLMLAYTPTLTVTGLMVALLVADPLRTSAARWFFESKLRPWFLPAMILALYVIMTLLNGEWSFQEFFLLGLYFVVPTFLIWRGSPRTAQATLVDGILIFLIWFPQEFGGFDVHWVSMGALHTLVDFTWVLFFRG